eukprot:365130-Chlamydomonas_euryale.AAC.14
MLYEACKVRERGVKKGGWDGWDEISSVLSVRAPARCCRVYVVECMRAATLLAHFYYLDHACPDGWSDSSRPGGVPRGVDCRPLPVYKHPRHIVSTAPVVPPLYLATRAALTAGTLPNTTPNLPP